MRKLRLAIIILALLLMSLSVQTGVSQAQDNYTFQLISTDTGANFVGVVQAIGGWKFQVFGESGSATVNFSNASVNGIYNLSAGLGSFRNQASLTYSNIQPDQVVSPATFLGIMYSENNRVIVGDTNYSVNLLLDSFQGSGVMVLNLMAGSFSNQFTTVMISIGRGATAPSGPLTPSVTVGDATVVALTNEQMEAIAATSNNEFIYQGKQKASATVQGTSNFTGVAAVTLSAGVNNMINHHVGVNFNTAP